MSLVAVEHLFVRYPREAHDVVRDVTLALEPGGVLGIVGESGSGKSTLLKAWLGLLPVRSGAVRWQGRDVATMTPREKRAARRLLQPVFQDPGSALDPRLTVADSLAEPYRIHGETVSPAVLSGLLAEVQLAPELLGRRPSELSAGQRQRVSLARALALSPRVLLLDEPVSALDVSVQAQVLTLLDGLRRARALSMVLVSHDLAVVRALATEVVVLFAGRVVERGPARDVLGRPKHPYTRHLVAASVARFVDLPVAAEPGCAFRARCPTARVICAAETPALTGGRHAWACPVVE